jgi:hypothetical protein
MAITPTREQFTEFAGGARDGEVARDGSGEAHG